MRALGDENRGRRGPQNLLPDGKGLGGIGTQSQHLIQDCAACWQSVEGTSSLGATRREVNNFARTRDFRTAHVALDGLGPSDRKVSYFDQITIAKERMQDGVGACEGAISKVEQFWLY